VLKNPKAQMALVLAVGLLAGYVASSVKFNPFPKADAGPPEKSAAFAEPAGGTTKGNARLAAHNNSVRLKAAKSGKKPNILVLWGDDIGYWNISAYNRGMMGYRTPNIDRIAREGAIFTDCYAQQSCTAGRAAFITGQSPFRTGLLKVGLPGAKEGISAKDPTLAVLLRPLGYLCGQFGKNHLGDRNEMLPTVHGFHEFFGNLYHLNAEEEPEHPDYPKNPAFKKRFGPRGVLKCKATNRDDPTVDPRFGKVGRQTIKDTGPLTRKRMETIDEEITAGALDSSTAPTRPKSRSSSGGTRRACTSGRT
jgi:arylsulfatase